MITSWDIYWITRLDYVPRLFVGLTFVFVFSFIILELFRGFERRPDMFDKIVVSLIAMFAIFGVFVSHTLPTTKEAVAIYALPKVINNEKVQELPDNALDFINTKLKAWTEETLGETEKK